MSCNCDGKTINIGMGCCEPVLAPIENYYTKYQIDKMISGITVSGVTEEQVDEKIASARTEIEAEIPTVPTNVSAFENDSHYITSGDTVFNNYLLKNNIWCGSEAEWSQISGSTDPDKIYFIY